MEVEGEKEHSLPLDKGEHSLRLSEKEHSPRLSEINFSLLKLEELLQRDLPYTLLLEPISTSESNKFFKLLSVGEILPLIYGGEGDEYTISKKDLLQSKHYDELTEMIDKFTLSIGECFKTDFSFNISRYSPLLSSDERGLYFFNEKNHKIEKFYVGSIYSKSLNSREKSNILHFSSREKRESSLFPLLEGSKKGNISLDKKILSRFTNTQIYINSIDIHFNSKGEAIFKYNLGVCHFRGVIPESFKVKMMVKDISPIFSSEENFICDIRERAYTFLSEVKFRIVNSDYEIVDVPFNDIYERV